MDYIMQISKNLRDLGKLSTKWVEYWLIKDYQQYQLFTKLVTQVQVRRIEENLKIWSFRRWKR